MPTAPTLRSIALALLATVALFVRTSSAQPVTPADLRRQIEQLQLENEALAAQVRTLTDQLAQALARHEQDAQRLAALEAELQRLRESGPSAPPLDTPDPTTEPVAPTHAPIPADPLASPASLLGELERRYQASFPTPDEGDAPNAAPAYTPALRKSLEQWITQQSRELRGPIEWRVRLTDLRALDRSAHAATLQVLDPASGLPIGEALDVAVPRTMVDRVSRELGPTGGDDKAPTWTLVGSIIATPRLNPDRPAPGVFNHPAFVGPYTEFGFDLDWDSITLVPTPP